MSDKKLIPEKIEIFDFKIVKGHIESPFEFDNSLVNGHDFSLSFETGMNIEKKLVKADFSVSIKTKSEGNVTEEAQGNFHFVFIFHIQNMEDLIDKSNDNTKELKVESSLGNALASITYSTSRGILMTRFQGTSLENFILPVINPNDLLK
jgi:hypothetical protein